jgi:hypothetical protein
MGRGNNRRRSEALSWGVMREGKAIWTINAVPRAFRLR